MIELYMKAFNKKLISLLIDNDLPPQEMAPLIYVVCLIFPPKILFLRNFLVFFYF